MKNPRLKNKYGLVSNTVVREPSYCLRSKGLYAYLCTYADSNNELTVGVDRMAAECNVDQSTIKRILADLKKSGVISRISRGTTNTSITILLK
jgi:predicted transcriptional regulator of viral defense system